jgi:hypothetical protein
MEIVSSMELRNLAQQDKSRFDHGGNLARCFKATVIEK